MKFLKYTSFIFICFQYVNVSFAEDGPYTVHMDIDWMEASDHNHKPNPCEIDAIIHLFQQNNINLVVTIATEGIQEEEYIEDENGDHHINIVLDIIIEPGVVFELDNSPHWKALKNRYANLTHKDARWALFGHKYSVNGVGTNSSGIAEIPGRDLLITTDAGNSRKQKFQRTATLLHELGHTFGLQHGGISQNSPNFLLNYPSIMNYRFQLTGVEKTLKCYGLIPESNQEFQDLQYSPGESLTLWEGLIEEYQGIGYGPVDFNCNGKSNDIISMKLIDEESSEPWNWCVLDQDPKNPRTLRDSDDWEHIHNGFSPFKNKTSKQYCINIPKDDSSLMINCTSIEPSDPCSSLPVQEYWVPNWTIEVTGDGPVTVLTISEKITEAQ